MLSDLIPDLKKCPNQKIREFTYFKCFLDRALPEIKNQIWKQFSDKVLYKYCSKKNLEHFGPKNDVPKMDFPLYFLKVIWLGGHILWQKIILKKPNTPEYAQVLVVACQKLNSVAALLISKYFSRVVIFVTSLLCYPCNVSTKNVSHTRIFQTIYWILCKKGFWS